MSTQDHSSESATILARGARGENFGDSPYARNAQYIVVGVHGTNNGPQDVMQVTNAVAQSLDHITTGRVIRDTSFSWQDLSGTTNQPRDRERAGDRLAAHIEGLIREGGIDPRLPVIVVPVGFSHGGNVAIGATPEISAAMRNLNLNGGIHMVTLSTPAYNDNGPESPTQARQAAANNGVTYRQDHFTVKGDGVVPPAFGNNQYVSGFFVRNHPMAAVSGWNGVDNHGAPQNSRTHIQIIQREVQESVRELTPGLRRASADYERDPVVASVLSGLSESNPHAREPVNPSTVAAIAEAAYTRFPGGQIGGVTLSPDGRAAFLVPAGQRLDDPASDRQRIALDGAAQRPFEEAWQRTAKAMETAAREPTALAVEPELARQASRGPSMA